MWEKIFLAFNVNHQNPWPEAKFNVEIPFKLYIFASYQRR